MTRINDDLVQKTEKLLQEAKHIQRGLKSKQKQPIRGLASLYEKIDELIKLRKNDLVDAPQFGNLLYEFIDLNMDVADLQNALGEIKKLENEGLLNTQGYEKISSLMVKKYYAMDVGIIKKVKSVLRKPSI